MISWKKFGKQKALSHWSARSALENRLKAVFMPTIILANQSGRKYLQFSHRWVANLFSGIGHLTQNQNRPNAVAGWRCNLYSANGIGKKSRSTMVGQSFLLAFISCAGWNLIDWFMWMNESWKRQRNARASLLPAFRAAHSYANICAW